MGVSISTFIKIHHINSSMNLKLDEIFTKYGAMSTLPLLNKLYGTCYTWNSNLDVNTNKELNHKWPDIDWLYSEVGSIRIESYRVDESTIILKTPKSVPYGFLQKLSEVLYNIREDSFISGTYESDQYTSLGAFLYGKLWSEVKEYPDEVHQLKMREDDVYFKEIKNNVEWLRRDMETLYDQDSLIED